MIHLDTVTTFKSSYTQFKIGEPWTEYTLDKRYTTTTPSLDGNKLIKDQVGGFTYINLGQIYYLYLRFPTPPPAT